MQPINERIHWVLRVTVESDRAYNVTAIHPHVIAIPIVGIWRWRLALTLASRPTKWERKIEEEKKRKSRIPYCMVMKRTLERGDEP